LGRQILSPLGQDLIAPTVVVTGLDHYERIKSLSFKFPPPPSKLGQPGRGKKFLLELKEKEKKYDQ
jgi:hypothetical protein